MTQKCEEFKEKLKAYEKMRTKSTSNSKLPNSTVIKKTKQKEEIRCFNCGEIGHKSTACENKSKDVKCFRCNEFGHKSVDCRKEKPKRTKEDEGETKKSESE